MSREYTGTLEVDHERGVIYFHLTDPAQIAELGLITLLRVCKVPTPIPERRLVDITKPERVLYMEGA